MHLRHLCLLSILLILGTHTVSAQSQPIGWASLNGGTTGGQGGQTVVITNSTDLKTYAGSNESYILLIQDTIELSLYERVRVGSNTTILGYTHNAMIRYGGFEVRGNNVIIQNLVIGDFYDGDWTGTTNSTDCLTIYGENVWVDHCWFWAAADGLLDIRSGDGWIGDYVTVSYCKFTDHNKVTLVGSSNDNTQDRNHLRVTFHHCWYDGTVGKQVNQRMPRVRYGDVHIFNNYYEDIGSYCVAARIESDIVVENTYFRNCPSPHIIDDVGLGIEDPDLVAINNQYELCTGQRSEHGTAFDPNEFYTYVPTDVRDVPAIVMNEAGPYNGPNNTSPIAITDSIDVSNLAGAITISPIDNDKDVDSDDLRLAQILETTSGSALVKENKIIYGASANAVGIDTIAYLLVDLNGGVDTGYVLIFHDGIIASTQSVFQEADNMTIFPNPADTSVTIKWNHHNSNKYNFRLSNMAGSNVSDLNYELIVNDDHFILETTRLESGTYIITLQNGEHIYSKALIIQH